MFYANGISLGQAYVTVLGYSFRVVDNEVNTSNVYLIMLVL